MFQKIEKNVKNLKKNWVDIKEMKIYYNSK